MKPVWLQSYPEHMPHEAPVDAFSSLVDLIEQSCARYKKNNALTNMGCSLTYADLDRKSLQFATYLQQECGFEPGDRFAIMMPNVMQYFVVLFGVLRAGLVVVNVNPLYTSREIAEQLKDSGAKGVAVLDNFAHTVEEALPDIGDLKVVTSALADLLPIPKRWVINFAVKYLKRMVPAYNLPGATRFNDALSAGAMQAFKPVQLTAESLAFLQYTGGTTGKPKAAMLSHGNMVANVQQALTYADGKIREAQEVAITPLPLYHIFSLTLCCFAFLQTGNEVVLITNPRDLDGFIKTMSKTNWTFLSGINTLYNALLNHPNFDQINFEHATLTIAGGAATSSSVAAEWKKRTGLPILEGYGLTEASPIVTINPFTITEHTGSIGLPTPSTQVDLRDDNNQSVPEGEIGELCVKGPQVMKGYWQQPEQTAEAIDAGGWLHTGDMARMDERGYLYIVDRKKEMVLVSGFNVYPSEIKQVLMDHPGVLEASVIGVPYEKTGEAVKAVIVKKDPNLNEQAIIEHCKENLTNYKRPRFIEFMDELPKSAVGKVLRRELREQHIAQQQQAALAE